MAAASEVENIITTKDATAESTHRQQQQQQQRKEIYVSRKYLDRFLQSPAYDILHQPEYHGVNNMHKLRKEVSETYAVLDSLHQCCEDLQLPETSTPLENVLVIDLCCGKGLTTAICGALYPKGQFIAIDRLPSTMVPHFDHGENTEYLEHDIMTLPFWKQMEESVAKQADKTVLLVGMHLCGNLAMRAIDLFHRIPRIRGLILSPCCQPKQRADSVKIIGGGDSYENWCNHLVDMIQNTAFAAAEPTVVVHCHVDVDIHSTKNCIIRAVKK